MSNYQQYIGYGHTPLVTQQAQAHSYPKCPKCGSPDGHILRLKRKWWERLLTRKGHYICLECDNKYWSR